MIASENTHGKILPLQDRTRTARGIRIWRRSFPKDRVQHFMNGIKVIGVALSLILCLSFRYYSSHSEFTPVIEITEFIALDSKHPETVNGCELLQVDHVILYSRTPKSCHMYDPFEKLLSRAFGRVLDHGCNLLRLPLHFT
ncbi:hypothetical protein AVEN_122442-1 [Araneus ventricosus]|uniref:Uncharacterized protein n=1 Tax=Araneus ventricosus TaxID=182803 RepID=A0A4Y2FN70_ARAVE|nr:hypothetical protein AVEN_122442-1 [Araneus ventricosus]